MCNNFTCEHYTKYDILHTASFSSKAPDNAVAKSPINVAFVGLGNMGLQMALNLAKPKGYDLPPILPLNRSYSAIMSTFN